MGPRRGRGEPDTLLARAPSALALGAFEALTTAPGFEQSDEALGLLHIHHRHIDERPLLRALVQQFAHTAASSAVAVHNPAAVQLVELAGLRTRLSDQLHTDARAVLHVSADGHRHLLDTDITTACAIPLHRSDMSAALRGSWKTSASAGLRRCPDCSQHAPDIADCHETGRYQAFDDTVRQDLTAALSAPVAARLRQRCGSPHAPSAQELDQVARDAYRQGALRAVATAVHRGGPDVLARAVGPANWRLMVAQRPVSDLTPAVWPADEWAQWLSGFQPDGRRGLDPAGHDRRLVEHREQLFGNLAADLQLKRPRR